MKNRIKEHRERCGLLQTDLAKRLDVDSTTVSSWERGRTEPSMALVSKMCAVFHCSAADLFGTGEDLGGVGGRLQTLREANGLYQEELAKKLNVSRACVSSWERNRTEPSLNQICDIAKLFNVNVGYLVTGYDEAPSQTEDVRAILAALPYLNQAALQQINQTSAYLIELNKLEDKK